MELAQAIREVQVQLGITADGKAGPATWTAIHEYIFAIIPRIDSPKPPAALAITGGTVDPRSETIIATLHERVRPYARSLVQKAAAAGITLKIISGLRTYAEQDQIYASSRTIAGPWRTNARGGYSNHNFGLAFDIGIFTSGQYLEDSPLYKAVAPIALDLGLAWGGDWKSEQDQPHYELRPTWAQGMPESQMLTELRRRKDTGRDYFA